jgi:hypothetical protein
MFEIIGSEEDEFYADVSRIFKIKTSDYTCDGTLLKYSYSWSLVGNASIPSTKNKLKLKKNTLTAGLSYVYEVTVTPTNVSLPAQTQELTFTVLSKSLTAKINSGDGEATNSEDLELEGSCDDPDASTVAFTYLWN